MSDVMPINSPAAVPGQLPPRPKLPDGRPSPARRPATRPRQGAAPAADEQSRHVDEYAQARLP